MKIVRFKWRGDNWNAYLIDKEEMGDFVEDKGDEETAAEVQWDKKEVYFNDKDLSIEIVRHEVVHIATGYHYLENVDPSFYQAEEFFCDLFAYDGEAMLKLSKELNKKLEELKRSPNKNLELVIKDEE